MYKKRQSNILENSEDEGSDFLVMVVRPDDLQGGLSIEKSGDTAAGWHIPARRAFLRSGTLVSEETEEDNMVIEASCRSS